MLDVEIVFLYPFAIVFRGLGAVRPGRDGDRSCSTLLVPFAYLLSVGALEWGPVQRRARSACPDRCCARARRCSTRARATPTRRSTKARGGLMGLDQIPHNFLDRAARRPRALGPPQLGVPGHVRARVLRDRDDGHRRRALRPRALRHGGLPREPAPGRPHDRRRARVAEDGAGAAPGLRPDGRAQVGHLDGRVREQRRHVQQLRDRAGRRPDRAGRRVRARAARPAPRR